ncbi:putative bifunctional diguanylate cyclase/phosphodiesterase [Variovorax sp. RHLX14]|uniref:putative bifunctional diguanylate cyclase/phosphodiesterase n=1 Tax=Variovorax sp. RHLX14 TaxID=1259731 RepID=UPI003F4774B4
MSTDASAYESLMQFLHQAPIGLVQTDMGGDIRMINPMAITLLMPLAPGGDLLNLLDVLEPKTPGLRARAAADALPGEIVCEALRIPLGSASTVQTLDISLVKLDLETLMFTITDATFAGQQEQHRIDTRLRDISRTDSLTAIPNRTVVLERIARATATAGEAPLAVIFINGDRFNQFNVSLGHAAGDLLLQRMAERLVRFALDDSADRTARAMVARLGGDEFAVLVEDCGNVEQVSVVAQQLLGALDAPYRLAGGPVHLSSSLGIAFADRSGGDADSVLQDASIAMRFAKQAGGARFCVFEPAMKEKVARRSAIESDLRRALEQDELFVVYQPIVRMGDGACAGMEALVRWKHPVRGIVPPFEFIEIAEETGLVGALGSFVLRSACAQSVSWKRQLGANAPQHMSVNVSRVQLTDPTLAAHVVEILRDTGMAAGDLQLEVTESFAAQDQEITQRLQELNALGIRLALDDFGTGYSSLACLHQLPVHVVKIDRSFVSQVDSSNHHRVLIEATILVARSLGMGTVAEGIETEAQSVELARLQCDKGQGYLFSRPMPAAQATEWLVARERKMQTQTATI